MWGGTQGQACVVGRDDDIGLALLKPLIELPHTPDYLALSREAASSGDQLQLFQHSRYGQAMHTGNVRVNGLRTFDNRYDYFRIEGHSSEDDAVLINERGELQGMRMSYRWQQLHDAGEREEAYVIDSPRVTTTALPLLRSGHMHIEPWWLGSTLDSPWSTPIPPTLFHGELTVDGAPAPMDSTIYARIIKEGLPDYWTSNWTMEVGYYILGVYTPSSSYDGATIEFWMDCRRATATAVFDYHSGTYVWLNLAF